MDYNKILNDIEKTELERLNNNPTLFNAIKKIICSAIYTEGVVVPGQEFDYGKNFLIGLANQGRGITHEHLGKDLMARIYALQLLDESFKSLESFKKVEIPEKSKVNKAR